jgi:nucleoside-diphosphate-sugar epimerase
MKERIFLAGATGAIGRRLVPLLVQKGFVVTSYHALEREGRSPTSDGREASHRRCV